MSIHVIFGVPGSGKTTHSAKMARYWLKKGVPVFSNFPIKGCYQLEKKVVGTVDFGPSVLILDESSIEYNSRNFKSNFNDASLYWWKMARHYRAFEIYVYSQSFDDMDLVLRRLCVDMFIVNKFPFNIIRVKKIRKVIDIDKTTHQVIDQYAFVPFSSRFILGRRYWKYFDSYECKPLPPVVRVPWYESKS